MDALSSPDDGDDVSANGSKPARSQSRSISQFQARHHREEQCTALRALLMKPLVTSAHGEFAAVRRHGDVLKEWFAREAGWTLHVERDCARLYKRPADLVDPTRGFPEYTWRRYVLFCLACAVLERADPQITLRVLGERLLQLAAEPRLAECGFTFGLETRQERQELVTVCRTLLDLGVLVRVAGDEEGYVHYAAEGTEHLHDALYDVHRRVLAGVLAAVRGPSTWLSEEAPRRLDERLHALVAEHVPDTEEGRRTAIRRDLARRLLDDPVVYINDLDPTARSYFLNQRGPMAARLADGSGLLAEQRAEGLALVDQTGDFTDVSMPAQGTEAHVTLLVAEFLCQQMLDQLEPTQSETTVFDIASFIENIRSRYGRYWRKSAREPGSERELARIALERLQKLSLISVDQNEIRAKPALARFAIGATEIIEAVSGSKEGS